jgi:CheY-like chemotaxis protein
MTCVTGDQVIDILRTRDTSLRWEVLVDYRLPGPENGLMVVDRIRHICGESVGVALMTGEIDGLIFEQAAERGIVTFRKPIKPIRLRAIVTALTKEGYDRFPRDPGANDPHKEAQDRAASRCSNL